jgi:hypothetical protein
MSDLQFTPAPRSLEENEEEALTDARLRLHRGIKILALSVPVLGGFAWLTGDVRSLGYGAPLLFVAWGVLRGWKDPKRLVTSEPERLVDRFLRGQSSDGELLRVDLDSAERSVHLRSVLDVLEGPDTFFVRNAKTLGPIVVTVATLAWLAGGVSVLALTGDWASAAVCLMASIGFVLLGILGRRADRPRERALQLIKKSLEDLGFGHHLPESRSGTTPNARHPARATDI